MSKLYKSYEAAKQIFGAAKKLLKGEKQKTTGTEVIKSVPVGKNLKTKRFQQDDIIKTRERIMTEYGIKDPARRRDLRKTANQPKINKKIADIADRKAKGGRVGYRKGTPKKQTNIQKIKKTFGPKGLGMQSVIYGLDKNPKITAADPKAKFIAAANKKKKKV